LPELPLVDNLVLQKASVAGIQYFYFLHHLAYDHLNMLIVDLHTLQSVYFLDFVDQVILYRGGSFNGQYVIWRNGSIRKRLPCTDKIVFLYKDVLGERHHISLLDPIPGFNKDFSVAALDASVAYHAVNF